MERRLTNAKEEFVKYTSSRNILCAVIQYSPCTLWKAYGKTAPISKRVALGIEYTPEDYELFLNELDFNYDAGYGGQELFGTVWFTDGTWLERGEYDGSEWWNLIKKPEISEQLVKASLIVELETDCWDEDESNEPF